MHIEIKAFMESHLNSNTLLSYPKEQNYQLWIGRTCGMLTVNKQGCFGREVLSWLVSPDGHYRRILNIHIIYTFFDLFRYQTESCSIWRKFLKTWLNCFALEHSWKWRHLLRTQFSSDALAINSKIDSICQLKCNFKKNQLFMFQNSMKNLLLLEIGSALNF